MKTIQFLLKNLFVFIILSCFSIANAKTSECIYKLADEYCKSSPSTIKLCEQCHIPFYDSNSNKPLWSNTKSISYYNIYTSKSRTMDAILKQPSGASAFCLSCHDGTMATDNNHSVIGQDLSNDHPISLTYDAALSFKDGELHNPVSTRSGIGKGTIAEDLLFGENNDQLECTSCHLPHDSEGNGGGLVMDNTNSELCLTCHIK